MNYNLSIVTKNWYAKFVVLESNSWSLEYSQQYIYITILLNYRSSNIKILLQQWRLNILFHSLSHSVPLSLSLSLSALILSQDSLNLSSSHPLSVTLLSHRHSHNLPHSSPSARLSRPKFPIASLSLSSLTITLSTSLIHRRWPDPAVLSRHSPQTHIANRLTPTSPAHPFCRPRSLTLCLFVMGDFFYFVCDWLIGQK